MLILKLVHNNDLQFIKELQDLREVLKKKDIVIGLVESEEGNAHIVKIMCNEEICNEKVKNMIYLYISNILYNLVIEQYRKKELFNFLTETFFFLKQDELLEVEKLIMRVLKGEENLKDENMIYTINKINLILEKIKLCVEENWELNVKGFITFRMKELREDIEDIIDKIVEEYMVDKEYKEFVKLLKYFVDIQDSKIDEINIYIENNGEYILRDQCGNDIFQEFIREITECKIETEAKVEDIIISGLITNAPKKVIIHHKERCLNREFLETILNVFGDKVVICTGCASCIKIKMKI